MQCNWIIGQDSYSLTCYLSDSEYAYIDNFEEARRSFVTEFGSTLFTIAGDVKLQVEFNPVLPVGRL